VAIIDREGDVRRMADRLPPNAPRILIGLVHCGERLSTLAATPLPFRVGQRTGVTYTGTAEP